MVTGQGFCPIIKEECKGMMCKFWKHNSHSSKRECVIVNFLINGVKND